MRALRKGEQEWITWLRQDPRRYVTWTFDESMKRWRLLGLQEGKILRRSHGKYDQADAHFVFDAMIRAVGRVCRTCRHWQGGRCVDPVVAHLGLVPDQPEDPCWVPEQYRAKEG